VYSGVFVLKKRAGKKKLGPMNAKNALNEVNQDKMKQILSQGETRKNPTKIKMRDLKVGGEKRRNGGHVKSRSLTPSGAGVGVQVAATKL